MSIKEAFQQEANTVIPYRVQEFRAKWDEEGVYVHQAFKYSIPNWALEQSNFRWIRFPSHANDMDQTIFCLGTLLIRLWTKT